MKAFNYIFLWLIGCSLFLSASCTENKNADSEQIDLGAFQAELLEGAWRLVAVVDSSGQAVINGARPQQMLFFFLDDGQLRGPLNGTYWLEEQQMFMQAEIEDSVRIFDNQYDLLSNFPPRYHQLEAIFAPTVSGKVEFFEAGYDSRFSLSYAPDRVMWFERY